jgi:hypothetical protein
MSSVQCSQFKGMAKIYDPAENNFGPEYVHIISNEVSLQPVDHFIYNCWKRKYRGLRF